LNKNESALIDLAQKLLDEGATMGLDAAAVVRKLLNADRDALLTQVARQLIADAAADGYSPVEAVRRLLVTDHVERGWVHRRRLRPSGRISKAELEEDRLVFQVDGRRKLELDLHERGRRRWILDGVRTDKRHVELELGAWTGFTDGVELVADHLERLQRQNAAVIERECKARAEELEAELEQIRICAIEGRHTQLAIWRAKNSRQAGAVVPARIAKIRDIKRLDLNLPTYVYFLLNEGEVVYVGQTSDAWPARIASHASSKRIKFDDVWFVEVDRESAGWVERKYIKEFLPVYNVAHKTSPSDRQRNFKPSQNVRNRGNSDELT
jgi:hypothetical protein